MKKFFILPFTIIFFVNQSYSQDLKTLVNDQSLKIYVQNELNFLAKGQNAEILKSIIKDKELTEDELRIFYQNFKMTEKSYFEFQKTQNDLLQTIDSKYHLTDLNGEQLTYVVGTILAEINQPIKDNNEGDKDCRERYNNCIGLALATATGAHLACAFADLTIIGGIACHATVLVVQYLAQNECVYSFEDCKP